MTSSSWVFFYHCLNACGLDLFENLLSNEVTAVHIEYDAVITLESVEMALVWDLEKWLARVTLVLRYFLRFLFL